MSAPSTNSRAAVTSRTALVAAIVCLVALITPGSPASAHTSFVGSDPVAGSTVAGPVSEVVLQFSGVSEEAGEGFVVLDPTGELREPTSVTTTDDKTFTLLFDPALSGGQIGVRWSVRAGDSHPINGSFSFTAGADAGVTSSTLPDGAATSEDSSIAAGEMAGMNEAAGAGGTTEMAEFLRVDATQPGETTARLGRIVTMLSVVIALGGAVFAAAVLRGPADDIRWLLNGVRAGGVGLAVGASLEYVGVARMTGEALSSSWSSSAGAATVLRIIAGIAIAAGIATTTVTVRRRARALSSAVNTAPEITARPTEPATDEIRRWAPDRGSGLAAVGVIAAVMSFWFDGHTVTEGFRPLHTLANSVHVIAGSVWAGGVIVMAAIMWRRRRHHRTSGALELVLRFSSIAAVALGAVVVAGLVMAVSILDSFADLTGTQWGQTLLLKSGAAAVAMVFGAVNHFRLIPALDADPDNPELRTLARSTVTGEAIVMVFVVAATASLVAAAV